jgi:transposase
MRGGDRRRDGFFSYVRTEDRIPKGHPLRVIREVANEALRGLSGQFDELYAAEGRPSIPPEQLLRALLLQAFYTIRSERQLMEQLNYNLLFRWFVGLSVDDPVWVPTVFSKNRERLLAGEIAAGFMETVLNLPRVRTLLSDEHFSVDGTLIQAWASMKSFRRRDGADEPPGPGRNSERNFRKDKRSNETHASTSDPDARLASLRQWTPCQLRLQRPVRDPCRRQRHDV